MKSINRKYLIVIAASLFLALSLSAYTFFNDDDDFEIAKNLELYHSVIRDARLYYVDETDYAELINESIHEMLNKLDPYTVYYPESMVEDYTFMSTGTYAGIGAKIGEYKKSLIITEVYKDSPADKAGLLSGDKIIAINGRAVTAENIDVMKEEIKGEPGSSVPVEISRYGVGNLSKTIERSKIKLPDVSFTDEIKNGIAYIKLNSFTPNAASDFKKALLQLDDSVGLKALVIDLRANPGGLLIEAVKIVNLFIDKGKEVVSTRGKVAQWNSVFKTQTKAVFPDLPLAVLVNSRSASASEIVAGALQDYDRAIIIGERTFGKGLVQTTRDLAYNAKIKITTAKYYIPSGRCVQALDYTHRRPDGSVGKVPDSLISEFTTSKGRKVYDGGGIRPDVEIKNGANSPFTSSEELSQLIFNYATKYHHEHKNKPDINSFSLSASDYSDFVQYACDEKFSYQTDTEKHIDSLLYYAEQENFSEDILKQMKELKKDVHKAEIALLNNNKQWILPSLQAEIISRYYYADGKIKYNFKHDPQILKAAQLLSDTKSYNKILTVK